MSMPKRVCHADYWCADKTVGTPLFGKRGFSKRHLNIINHALTQPERFFMPKNTCLETRNPGNSGITSTVPCEINHAETSILVPIIICIPLLEKFPAYLFHHVCHILFILNAKSTMTRRTAHSGAIEVLIFVCVGTPFPPKN